ncbi:hypothetical protein BX666DRAFT_2030932 [Dichotomocladium elegans]|nr:hypothetical protein BX666DRAFT_2030932 [Dichotomocladium elegans]
MKMHLEERDSDGYESDAFETADEASIHSNDGIFFTDEPIVMDVAVAETLRQWQERNVNRKKGTSTFTSAGLLKYWIRNHDEEVKRTANALWHGAFVPPTGVLSYLAKPNPFHRAVLRCYFEHFDFNDQRLDNAFRQICAKVYIKARPVELDRVLYEFARHYWASNLHEIFGSTEIVYVITGSLVSLALPDDGPSSLGNYCRDTMALVKAHESTANISILACGGVEAWRIRMTGYLEEFYISTKRNQIIFAGPHDPDALGNSTIRGKLHQHNLKLDSTSSNRRLSTSWTSIRRKDVHHEKMGPTKQGPLACKSAKEDILGEAWKPCWVIIDRGSLVIYIQSVRANQPRLCRDSVTGKSSPAIDYLHQKGNLSANPYQNSILYLGHALAQSVDRSIFCLTLANRTSYLFDCGTEENAFEWMSHCNLWAARESKIPLHIEISCDLHTTFHAPPPPAGASVLGPEEQRDAIKNRIALLCSVYDQHQELYSSLPQNHGEVINNWRLKKEYLAYEIKKYIAYEDSLDETESKYRLSRDERTSLSS